MSTYSPSEIASIQADAYEDEGEDYWAATISYFVEAGHSLLAKHPQEPMYMILKGKPQLGGRNWFDGSCAPNPADLRPATRADFDFFRVRPEGHLSEDHP